MKASIKNLDATASAASIPIFCPDMQAAHKALDNFFENICKKGAFKGPDIPVFYLNMFAGISKGHDITLSGKRVLDFGCGYPRPIGLAILHYLCGAERVLALDTQDFHDQAAVAIAAAGTLISVLTGRLKLDFEELGATWSSVRKRIADFDIEKLLRNDVVGGIPDNICLMQSRYENLPEAQKKFDIMVSHSVFEHVDNVPEVLRELRENISDDGFMYIAIDYCDHRIYTVDSGASIWEYMMDDDDSGGAINCIRHSTFMQMIKDSGFEVVECQPSIVVPSKDERSRFLSKYQTMPEEDVTTISAYVLLCPRIASRQRSGVARRWHGLRAQVSKVLLSDDTIRRRRTKADALLSGAAAPPPDGER